MELDRELLNQLQSLDNASLERGIDKIARSFGIDPRLASSYLGNTDQIRAAIASLDQKDLDRITAAIGEETAGKLADEIRREVE